MIARRIAAASLAGGLAVGLVAGPVVAANGKGKPDKGSKVKGTTSVMFTKSVKKKLVKDGIVVKAVDPAKKRNAVKFVFPAAQTSPQVITHTGGLEFVRGEKSLTITNFVFDLAAGNVDVTVPGVGDVPDALDLAKVKITKKTVKAHLNVALGKGEVLNTALGTTLFKDGMFLAKSNSKF